MTVLGVVRLAPGQVGYFDDLTRIHLTIKNPEKLVLAGMNTTNLKRAVQSGRIQLVSGSFEAPETNVQPAETAVPAEVTQEVKEAVNEVKEVVEEIKVEKPVIEEAPVAEVVEEATQTADEVPAEEPVKKAPAKKKTSKK